MPVNIQGLQSLGRSAEFRAFLEEANKALGNNVVHGSSAQLKTNEQGNLDSFVYAGTLGRGEGKLATIGKFIEHKLSTDKIHRTAAQRETNNVLRQEFLKALSTELEARGFKGFSLANLPSEIKEALRLSDFGLKDGDRWDKTITTGKPLTARRILAINKALNATLGPVQNATVADPHTLVLGILSGRILPSRNTGYQKNPADMLTDVAKMLDVFSRLSQLTGSSRSLTTVINGQTVTLQHVFEALGNEQFNEGAERPTVHPKLMATVDGVTVEVPGGAEAMLEALERDISSNVALYGRRNVLGRLDAIERHASHELGQLRLHPGAAPHQVPNEFNRLGLYYQRVLKSMLGEDVYKSIRFETLSLSKLGSVARAALNGGYKKARAVEALRREINVDAKACKLTQLNSERVLQLVDAYDGQMQANEEDVNRRVAVVPPAPKLEERMPTKAEMAARRQDAEIHELFGELILRSDTWAADRSKKTPGRQLFDTCLKHKEAFAAVIRDTSLLDTFDVKDAEGKVLDLPVKKAIKDMIDGMLGEDVGGMLKLMPQEAIVKILEMIGDYWELVVDLHSSADGAGHVEGLATQLQEYLLKTVDQELADVKDKMAKAYVIMKPFYLAQQKLIETKRAGFEHIAEAFSPDKLNEIIAGVEEGAASVNEAVDLAMTSVEDAVAKAVQETFGLSKEDMDALREKPQAGRMQRTEIPPAGEMWKKNLKAIAGDGAISPKSGMGRFLLQGIVQYFTSVSAVDQRAMLSSMLRYTRKGATQGQVLGAFLKGAGPILQKEMQGLPTSQMPEDLQTALADMKDSLAPIPDHIVRAQINQMVLESKGAITSVVVRKSLGAASVGQAFLCEMTLKDGTVEPCVIKMLRPDVQPRAQRERVFFERLAASIPGMKETFAGDLRAIMDELDLTIEAENARAGAVYHMNPDINLKSVGVHPLVKPTANLLVLRAAPGDTIARILKDTKEECKKISDATKTQSHDGNTVFRVPDFDTLLATRERLVARYRTLAGVNRRLDAVVRKWTSEAVFRSGFFHGDMHAGNLMVAENKNERGESEFELTIIDYGNATRLTDEQQANVVQLLLTAGARDADGFMNSYRGLLSKDGKRAFDRAGATLKNEIRDVLRKGTAAQTAERMMAVMMMTQRRGIELPETIYKFVKSEMRLAGAMEDVTNEMESIRAQLASLSMSDHSDATRLARYAELDPLAHLSSRTFGSSATDDDVDRCLGLAADVISERKSENYRNQFVSMFHPYRPLLDGAGFIYAFDGYNDRNEKQNVHNVYLPDFIDDYVDVVTEGADPDKAAALRTARDGLKKAIDEATAEAREQKLLDDGLTIYQQIQALRSDISLLNGGSLKLLDPAKAKALQARIDAIDRILSARDGALDAFVKAVGPILTDRFEAIKARLEKTTNLPTPLEFGEAFGDEMLLHSGDALQILGYWKGGKLANRMEDVGAEDQERVDVIEQTVRTVHEQFKIDYDFAQAPRVLDEKNRLTMIQGMVRDFVQPPNMGKILGTAHWVQNADNRALFLDMLRVNLTDYHKRIEEMGALEDMTTSVYTEPDYYPEQSPQAIAALRTAALDASNKMIKLQEDRTKLVKERSAARTTLDDDYARDTEAHQARLADLDKALAEMRVQLDALPVPMSSEAITAEMDRLEQVRQAEETAFATIKADYDAKVKDWNDRLDALDAKLKTATDEFTRLNTAQGEAANVVYQNKVKRETHENCRKLAMAQFLGSVAQLGPDKGGVAHLKTAFAALTPEELALLKAEAETLEVEAPLITTLIQDAIDAIRLQAVSEHNENDQ